jgi:eukaryotic-like serine/threonine-protein kinase
MNEPIDPNQTADVRSAPADSLDPGLASGFAHPADAPGSVLSGLRSTLGPLLRPVLLPEAEGESALVVMPKSDAMPSAERVGGRYQLSGEIARGGMGAVLRGRDVDLGRDLAVKVLLEKYANRPEVARRFIEEAQIGGQLQHPGVVPVYDIGRFGDRPYFTMKLVKGRTLAAILGDRPDPSADRPRLIAIALQISQTLAYAHAKGVIHRDLKPANIMVGAFGEVQVMDWGVAKVLASGGIADEELASRGHRPREDETTIRTARSGGSTVGTDTEAGSILGTPAYMPPEQAAGDIALLDRRADVFGLGAILCEILTGKPPYVGRSGEEVRRKAANGDLADALTRLAASGADAELIALTTACLAPEAVDRPKDAQAVADALTNHLEGVQDRLRQAELAEAEAKARALEAAKRRRLTRVLQSTMLLAVALGTGGWLWVRGERQARRIALTRDVNEALTKATASRERAKAATTMESAALFAQAREQTQRALALVENSPADAALAAQVRGVQAILDEEEKDRTIVAAIDAARLARAESMGLTDRFAKERAVPLYREAFRAYGLPAGVGDPAMVSARIRNRPAFVRETMLSALDDWDFIAGEAKYGVNEPHREWLQSVLETAETAESWVRQLWAARRETDPAKRQAAVETLATSADVRRIPPQALSNFAWLLRPVDAVALYRRAQQQYPGDFWINLDLGETLQSLTPPERVEAIRFLTVAVALRPESAVCHYTLAHALHNLGRLDDAVASYRKAIEVDPNYIYAYGNLGTLLSNMGRNDEAIAYCRKAVEINPKSSAVYILLSRALTNIGQIDEAIVSARKGIELDPKLAGTAYTVLARAQTAKGQHDEAIANCRKAVEMDPNDAFCHNSLGFAFKGKGQSDEAIASFRKAIELDPDHAGFRENLGSALREKGQLDEAIASFRKALEIHPNQAKFQDNLGSALREKGQLDEAITRYRKAIELDPNSARAHNNLGIALMAKGQLDEAIGRYRKAIELDPKFANPHNNLGIALKDKGRIDEAIASYRKAIELDPKYAYPHNNLGVALKDMGRVDEAIASYRKAIELDPKFAIARSNLAKAAQMAEGRDNLPDFQSGRYKPATSAEFLGLIDWCLFKKLNHTAAGLSAQAFTFDPKLNDDPQAGHRYNAACFAALAAAGHGEDATKLDDQERARLRKQSLEWLRADLTLRTKQLETGTPTDRTDVLATMKHWQKDSDLASIRDEVAQAKLPPDEREALTQLWADVTELLKLAQKAATNQDRP